MAALDKLEELNLTQDEIKRFTDAMQKPEFKELLFEYAQEISDPENRARYEMEIREMENERGMDVKFVNPEPGYVIKTSISGDKKAFINVCKNQHIGKPSSTKKIGGDGRPGLCWSLPHSFTPPREDISKTGVKCTVFDFVVHPDTYRMAETNPRFKSMVNDTALEGIKKMFDVDVDAKNLRFPKIKYKGNPASSVIRTKLSDSTETVCTDNLQGRFEYPYDSKTSEEKSKEIMERNEKAQALKAEKERKENKLPHEKEFIKPKYIIKYQSNLDIQDFMNVADARNAALPKNLIIEVDLPMLQSANPISLDVFEKRLSLVSHKPAKYKLDIDLAYPVDENEGSAKFDKNKKKLIVTLPVVCDKNIPKLPFDGKTFEDDNNSEGESNGVGSMCKSEQVKPLIEVISEQDLEPAVECSFASTNGEKIAPAAADDIFREYDNLADKVVYLLPDFECQQDDSSLLFTFGTKNVRKDSVLSNVLSYNAISVKMTSVGSGGFPVYYSCCLKFPDDSYVDMNNCQVSFSEKEGVSLLVTKDSRSIGQWQSYSVGVDMAQLQERNLEMKTRILSTESTDTSLQTTLFSDNVIKFDVNKVADQNPVMFSELVKPESISTEMETAVVHQQGSPDVYGILKQYSTSESSDASDDAPTIHGETSIMASGGDAEDVADSLTGLKKSVSFSEEVDRTDFMANQNISQMQCSLKDKQKNVRKCKKNQQLRQEQTKCDISVNSGDDQCDDQNMRDVAQININKTVNDTALVDSQLDEIESEVGRGHVNGNRSGVPSDRNNSNRKETSSSIADEDHVGEKNSDESAEDHDCKTIEGETNDDHGALRLIQENKENKSLTSNDCSMSQLNTSADKGALAEKRPEVLEPSAVPHVCESQKASPAAVNSEKKANLMVEMKNKFVFDLDVD